jgi:hypothetical protein
MDCLKLFQLEMIPIASEQIFFLPAPMPQATRKSAFKAVLERLSEKYC